MTKPLSRQQALKYNRQILMPEFDLEGQESLLASHALVVGMGGLGCACAQYLASSGFGRLTLVDADSVELTNLPRQILFNPDDVGKSKVDAASQSLRQLNPDCQVESMELRLAPDSLTCLPQDFDIIVDCTDNLETRNLLNQLSVQTQRPLVSAAAIRMEGQISSFIPGPEAPCYACVSALFAEPELSCVESGVMAPMVGIMGTMQALETIKIVTGLGQPLAGKLQLYDAMSGEWQQYTVPKRPDCPVCSTLSESRQRQL